jgi:hypothetical protein
VEKDKVTITSLAEKPGDKKSDYTLLDGKKGLQAGGLLEKTRMGGMGNLSKFQRRTWSRLREK